MILLGDFNVESTEKHMKDFSLIYSCKKIIRDKTCCKSPENVMRIGLIMTNTPISFQNLQTIETELSNFHNICFTVLKFFRTKQKPHIQFRSYKKFLNDASINDLRNTFFQFSSSWENCSFGKLKKTVEVTLKKHVLLNKKIC